MRRTIIFISLISAVLISMSISSLAGGGFLTDISGNKYETAIRYLHTNGVVSGYQDNTFRPNNLINRAELMKILVGGTGAAPSVSEYSNCFPDVKTDWYAPYVCYALDKGWVDGYPDGTFKPEKNVNKVEAIKMLVNSQGYEVSFSPFSERIFPDVDNSAWYVPYLKVAFDMGLLEDFSGNYGVSSFITRGEISENIYRAMTYDGTNVSPNDDDNLYRQFEEAGLTSSDTSELSQSDKAIVQEWINVTLNKFKCSEFDSDKLNFVFIPIGYDFENGDVYNDFKLYSQWMVWSLNFVEPFKSYESEQKAWVYIPDEIANDYKSVLGLSDSGAQEQTTANEVEVIRLRNEARSQLTNVCPNLPKSVYVYVQNSHFDYDSTENAYVKIKYLPVGSFSLPASGAMIMPSFGYKAMLDPYWHYNIFENHLTFVHELGHTYAGFVDEYGNYGQQYDSMTMSPLQRITTLFTDEKAPSCVIRDEAETLWGDLVGKDEAGTLDDLKIGFYDGCGNYSNIFRPSDESIMSFGSAEFNKVQQRFLCEVLNENIGKKLGVCTGF